jgi:hypothetical protein
MSFRIQIRRDTASKWASSNPVLLQGEQGYETDTFKMKIGNGVDPYNDLSYWYEGGGTGSGPTGPAGATGATGPSGSLGSSPAYCVRFDYDSANQINSGSYEILTSSPWISAGLSITVNDVDKAQFTFANEATPPRNTIGYFYNAQSDKYTSSTFGIGSVGNVITKTLSSTISSNKATNNFFSLFSSSYIEFDLTPSNYGGTRIASVPIVNTHCYIIFGF